MLNDPADPFVLLASPAVYPLKRKATSTTMRILRASGGIMAGWYRFDVVTGSQHAIVLLDQRGMEQVLTAMLADERLAARARSMLATVAQAHRRPRDTMPPS